MYQYENKLPIDIVIERPDFKTFLLLDRDLQGCKAGLKQASVYMQQAYMIHNKEFHDDFMHLGISLLNDMEVLATIIHLFHGEDDRYYDESNDDTPVFELIKPLTNSDNQENDKHHVNNDLTAALLRDIQFEENRKKTYNQILVYLEDEKAKEVFTYLREQSKAAASTLKNILTILTTHTEIKDFGEGNTHNAWDLDTSNYFDKPNPTFINPGELKDIRE